MQSPGFSNESVHRYYPLGTKTLAMMMVKRSGALVAFILVLAAGFAFWGYLPEAVTAYALVIFSSYLLFIMCAMALTFFVAWVEYLRFAITISEKDLRIKKGFISTEEIGIPFRRIRDVKIKRSLVDQIIGTSDIVIVLSDFEDVSKENNEESLVSLLSLDNKIAIQIQESILRKSQVEQIDVLSGHDNMLRRPGM